ncbi:MAG: Uma2 family endonuclease [Bacteroidota bacterium]
MAGLAIEERNYSIKEYLELDKEANERYEYENGTITAMSGGIINHGVLCNNSGAILREIVQKKGLNCTPFGSEVKVFIEKSSSFVYPDAMLICGEIETSEEDKNAVINPVLVIEVLSKRTERYDRSKKFRKYCSLPSFREYILIDQYQPIVDVLYKADPTFWKMTATIGLDKELYINTLDEKIKMKELYQFVQRLKIDE